MMTEGFKKAIIDFAKEKLGDELEFKVRESEDGRAFLCLVVDCMKMDKNSGGFDQEYFDKVTQAKKEKPKGLYLDFGSKVMDKVTRYFKEYMKINLESWFNYKNYDYIDSIGDEVQEAIKKSSYPEVETQFSGNGDDPKLRLTFYNLPSELFNENSKFNDFILSIESILGFKYDLDQYGLSKTMGNKD